MRKADKKDKIRVWRKRTQSKKKASRRKKL